MREIKFRAWLKKEKRIIEPVIQLYFGHMPYIGWYETEQDALEGKLTTAFMDEVVLIEWTGSRDKNGKQIYEGDIIEFDKWLPNETFVRVIRGEVYWSDKGYWAVRNKDGKFLELLGRTENPEQIGNIYEHPHLLKVDGSA